MSRNPYARWAAMFCSILAVGLAVSASPAIAQTKAGELVSTFCGAGMVSACGSEPIAPTCEYEFSITKDPNSLIGITISLTKCTYHGYKTIYKDYKAGGAAGACVAYPRTPADATSRAQQGYDEEVDYGSDAEC